MGHRRAYAALLATPFGSPRESNAMKRIFAWLLPLACTLGVASPSSPQTATLTPPDDHYFVSRGSWGQSYPDQWALDRIGFDSTPNSAWRLVKRNAQPVVVALIDTGLDWDWPAKRQPRARMQASNLGVPILSESPASHARVAACRWPSLPSSPCAFRTSS